jgi:hypothetical protein
MNAIVENDSTIVTRHWIQLLYLVAKGGLLLLVGFGMEAVFTFYKNDVPVDLVRYFVFPVVILLVNYAFLQLAFGVIRYYNKLIIIARDRIILVTSSLFLQEDIEITDLSKVIKIDVECHGFFPNLFNYGSLIIEQQTNNEIHVMHFVPDPYTVLRIIREKTNYVSGSGDSDLVFFKV